MSLFRLSILTLLLALFCGQTFAQSPRPRFRRRVGSEQVEHATKSEAIEWQYERVLVKGFSQIATFTARDVEVRVDAVELKETATATRAIGLVIALRETGENPRENRSFIDYDEIDRLLQGLTAIGRVNESVTKLAGFEARYRTSGDLEIIVFRQSRSGIAASLTAGICERVTAPLTLDELDRLKAHIVEAKTRLDEIK